MDNTLCRRISLLGAGAIVIWVGAPQARAQGFFRAVSEHFSPAIGGLSGNGRYLVVNTDQGRVGRYSIETDELIDIARGTATDISGDGATIVGHLVGGPFDTDFIWNGGEARPFQISVNGQEVFSRTRALSGDGSVVVGQYFDPMSNAFRPFRWTSQGGGIPLAGTPGSTDVYEVSANGQFPVGWAFTTAEGARAVRWNASGQRTVLGELPGGVVDADAQAVSANGSVVFGTSASSFNVDEIFRWTAITGMVGLGAPFGSENNLITGVDSAGATIVGNGIVGGGFQPFLWREDLGFVDFEEYLRDQGLDLGENHIVTVFGVSNDGQSFTGIASAGRGGHAAFVARIPSPTSAAPLAPLLLAARRRRRKS